MIIEMWRVFVSKIDQNVHSSTEFNFDKCYRLASCKLQEGIKGEVTLNSWLQVLEALTT